MINRNATGLTVLLDCDGVLAHFTKTFLEYLGLDVDTHEPRINQFDIVKALNTAQPGCLPADAYARFSDAVTRLNVCSTIPAYPGARDFVDALSAAGHTVLACTSPFNPAWLSQRAAWLERHMGIPLKQQIHCADKSRIRGDVLIDDNVNHCEAWLQVQRGRAVLFNRPWNAHPKYLDRFQGHAASGYRARAMSHAHCLELLR